MASEKKTVLKTLLPEDVLNVARGLTDGEVESSQQIDSLLESKYHENINQHWIDTTIPEDYFRDLGELNYFNNPLLYKDRPNAKMPSQLFQFFVSYLLARFDISLATLLGVHRGLGHSTFYFGGSKEQVAKYVPKLQSHELRTCFVLTEPEHDSDIAGGLKTVVERRGNTWVVNGGRKQIGGARVSDVIPVSAVNEGTGKPHCFVVRPEQDGVDIEVVDNKTALRIVPNALIKLTSVKIDEADRLQNITSLEDIAKILYSARAGVAYMATGGIAGALCATLDYVTERKRFGKSISKYQLIRKKLAMVQGDLAQIMTTCIQLANMQAHGEYDEVTTSTAKMMNASRLHEIVTMGRGVTGGNGILADDYDIARFFSDTGAIYTYKGTHGINALVTGRASTGDPAFV